MKKARISGEGYPGSKELHTRIEELENEISGLRKSLDEKQDREDILKFRLELNELSLTESFDNIVTAVVDSAEKLINSKIGFFHFYDEHTETIKLQTWSTNALKQCSATPPDGQYSLSIAGVWTDCIKEGKPVIHNDYASLSQKKGLPQGHVRVTRELIVPIIREGIIVGVLGVGNKDTFYDDRDVNRLTQFAEIAWEIVVNKQLNIELEKREDLHSALLNTMFEGVSLNELVFDDNGEIIDYRILGVNSSFDTHSIARSRDVIGKLATDVFKMDPGYIKKFWHDNYFTDKPMITDYYDQEPDRWIRISTSPLKNNKFTTVFFDITDIKKAEENRQKNEIKYRSIIDTSFDGFWIVDSNRKILEVNNSYIRMSGYSREEILSMSINDFDVLESNDTTSSHIKQIMDNGLDIFETIHRKKDGSLWHVEINVSHTDAEKGLIHAFLHDITRRKETEQEKEVTIKLLSVINSAATIAELLGEACHIFREYTGCEAAAIRYRDGEDYPFLATTGFSDDFVLREKYLCSRYCSGEILKDSRGKPVLACMCGNVLSGQVDHDLPYFTSNGSFWTNSTTEFMGQQAERNSKSGNRNRCNAEGYESVALVPLGIGKEKFGLLQLNDTRKGVFNLNKINLIERLSAYISGALSHFENQNILIRNENRYREISSLISNIAYSCKKRNGTFRFDWIAGSVQKTFGFSIEEMYGKECWKDLVVDKDQHIYTKNIEKIRSGQKTNCELRIKTRDGSIRWINSIAECHTEQDETVLYGAIIDITDEKIADEALKIIREDLEEAQSIAKIGSWEYFNQSDEINCSEETKKIFGINSDSPVLRWTDFGAYVMKEDLLDLQKKVEEFFKEGTDKFSHELRIIRNGGFTWAHVIGKVNLSEDGILKGIKGTVQDITERKNAITALNHSHDLMRYIIEHNRGAVAVHDRGMRYIYVSQRYLSDYGIREKNIIGRHHYDVFPDLPQKWRKAHQLALKGKILRMEDDTYVREDGTVEWTRWECRPWYEADKSIGGIIVYTEVISERKKIELALKNSELQLNAMFNSAPVIMILLDRKMDVLKMNKFAMEFTERDIKSLTGIKPGDVLNCINSNRSTQGCGFSSVCKSCTLKNVVEETFSSGKEYFKVESQIISSEEGNLKNRTVLVSTSVIDNFPEKNVLVTVDDISARKELENELIKAKDKAEESDRLKTAFLANISHEIRTPMNGIMGFSEMLTKPGLSDEKKKNFSNLIQDGCRQLLSIITDVIDISMLDSDQMNVTKSEFRINEFLQDLFLQFRSSALNKSLDLKFIKGKRNTTIITDREKLKHIFSNLISNSLKFTKQGSIEFGYSLKGNSFEFYVSDTGIGIEKELFEAIFERFRQAETSETRNYGGTGLGLSIVKGLVALLDGRIWLESEPGKGTRFFFTIPGPGNEHGSSEQTGLTPVENEVLVAEDDDINFLFMQEVLQDINCLPRHARNGTEALRMLEKHPDIRLIFMDLKMPVMNGFKAAHAIRKLYPSIPIYAQTAYSLSTLEDLKQYGFQGCISKPINKEELESVVRKHLNIPE